MASSREAILAAGAPAAIGPYSHAVRAGGLVFLSGNIAIDAGTGTLVGDGDAAAETRRILANMALVLQAAGTSVAQVVRTTIFLVDLGDFAAVNQVYGEAFGRAPPARTTVEVSRLPMGARVEIDAIAVVD
jgi:2-iminobutanoate/2-iminopropanoate deaminase